MQVVDNYFPRAKKGFQVGNLSTVRLTQARKIALTLFPKPITAKDTL
jgi:hypothetical protein